MAHKRPRSAVDSVSPAAEFVTYGTPLPPLDSAARDDGSYVPLWKQEVTDERGRKRLHGAFTGGFSAGYFNTVGSKEGWAPATFKSSRTARAATKASAPEDFMDEEDIREAEEAKVLETNRDFSGLGQTQDTPPLDFLMPAMHSTRGYTLLRKMGWKDGTLIGPKTAQWSPPATSSSESAEVSPGSTVESPRVFAPKRKDDAHGLGFQGDAPRSEKRGPAWNSLSKSAFVPTASSVSSRRKPKGSAFGVGVLNDVDDEDDDAYEIRPKTAYYSSLDPERAKSRKGALRPTAKHKFVSKKAAPSTLTVKKCHDSRLPLTGFRLSSTLDTADVLWPLPSVPDGWAPATLSNPSSTYAPRATQQLDPVTRAEMLGESPLPGKSVFSYISADSRNRLAALTGRVDLPPGLGEIPALAARPTVTSAASDLIPALESHIASAALNHPSMPYADDPDKRRRYRTFLEIKAGQRDGLPERPYAMHSQEWVKEMSEFAAAARVFRPLAGSIANRFTSSTSTVEGNMSATTPHHSDSLIIHAPASTDAAGEAADMGMYGPLTRTILDFRPSHLLCKRVGISVPCVYQKSSEQAVPKSQVPGQMPFNYSAGSDSKEADLYSQSVEPSFPDPGVNKALEEERAADEVFQAIFGDDV